MAAPGSDGRADPTAIATSAEISAHVPHGHAQVVDDRAAALWAPPGAVVDTSPPTQVLAAHALPERIVAGVEFAPGVVARPMTRRPATAA